MLEFGQGMKVIPLGGLESIGMNITAFEYKNSIVVVDCGLSFPTDDMPGIDMVIPDVDYLERNLDRVEAFVITHGHEDHIGALPYVLRRVNVPIYATRLTIALIEKKLEEHEMMEIVERHTVNYGDVLKLGEFKVEIIRTNHSIADSAALAITTKVGTIVHSGDFKIDYTPVFGDIADLQRFGELGKKGVLALLCDSTNAIRPGFTMSEKTVGRTFDTIFAENVNRRIIVATFASNVARVQQIINAAAMVGRKVVCVGRSMVNVINTALELEYLEVPDGVLIDISEMKDYDDDELVIITTGSQGEPMAALSRMASGEHKAIEIKEGDTVIFSSRPVPGNEKTVTNVINELMMRGAKVIYQDAHVSGHASQEELKLIYSLVKPKYFIPVHGEFKHLTAHSGLVRSMGHDPRNILILSNGMVLKLDSYSAVVTDRIDVEPVLVDGLGVGDVGNVVLKDRKILSQEAHIV